MLKFENFSFAYDPFPIAVARPCIDPALYTTLVEEFPSIDLFEKSPSTNKYKYALAERYHPEHYYAFLRSSEAYRSLYLYVKSPQFVHDVLSCFENNHVELRLFKKPVISSPAPLFGEPYTFIEKVKRRLLHPHGLRTRFEFSAIPSDGGNLQPHTDSPTKIITLVISIAKDGEWKESWGGGTDVLKPKDMKKNYNFYNKILEFEECETIRTIPYTPNQCVLFIKTFNSLHSVPPIHGDGKTLRKTLTINIEDV